MAEDAAIRRANLVRLLKTPKEAHAKLGGEGGLGGYSYWAALMNDAKKPFGEKMARKIEERMNWPRGLLDSIDEVEAARGEGEREAHAAQGLQVDWRTIAVGIARRHPHPHQDCREAIERFIRAVDEEYAELSAATAQSRAVTR